MLQELTSEDHFERPVQANRAEIFGVAHVQISEPSLAKRFDPSLVSIDPNQLASDRSERGVKKLATYQAICQKWMVDASEVEHRTLTTGRQYVVEPIDSTDPAKTHGMHERSTLHSTRSWFKPRPAYHRGLAHASVHGDSEVNARARVDERATRKGPVGAMRGARASRIGAQVVIVDGGQPQEARR